MSRKHIGTEAYLVTEDLKSKMGNSDDMWYHDGHIHQRETTPTSKDKEAGIQRSGLPIL